MALHKDFPDSPHAILDPSIRWFPADEALRAFMDFVESIQAEGVVYWNAKRWAKAPSRRPRWWWKWTSRTRKRTDPEEERF